MYLLFKLYFTEGVSRFLSSKLVYPSVVSVTDVKRQWLFTGGEGGQVSSGLVVPPMPLGADIS